MAFYAAHASQGHIGRAKWLATDEAARSRRDEVLRIPAAIAGVPAALAAAAALVNAAADEAKQVSAEQDLAETEAMRNALGAVSGGRAPAGTAGVLKDLEERHKRRAKRIQRDSLDRALVDLAAFYRDVLAVQFDAAVEIVNESARGDVESLARSSTPEDTVRRIGAVLACREAMDANAHPLLAAESMMLALRTG